MVLLPAPAGPSIAMMSLRWDGSVIGRTEHCTRSEGELHHGGHRGKPADVWETCSIPPHTSTLFSSLGTQSVRERSVVHPGLESFPPLFPALKRWAKLGRPSGAGFSWILFHW